MSSLQSCGRKLRGLTWRRQRRLGLRSRALKSKSELQARWRHAAPGRQGVYTVFPPLLVALVVVVTICLFAALTCPSIRSFHGLLCAC